MTQAPPHAPDAEAAVLGSILLDYTRVLEVCMEQQVVAECFYVPAHRLIYAAMLDLYARDKSVDQATVGERLRIDGTLDKAGGPAAINALIDATPSSAHAEHYIDIVKQKHLLRGIIDVASNAIVKAQGAEDAEALRLGTESALADLEGGESHDVCTTPETWDAIEERMAHAGEGDAAPLGIDTGIDWFDRTGVMQFRPVGMYLLMGRQKSFKTTVACHIAVHQVRMGRKVGFCSREMPEQQLLGKMGGMIMNCSIDNVLRGTESVSDEHAAEARRLLRSGRLTISDKVRTVDEFVSWYRRGCRKKKWDLVVLDYLQKLDAGEGDRWEGIRKASERITDAAKTMGVPILCVAIPSDDGQGMSKMYGSKQGDFDTYAKMLVYREYEDDPASGQKVPKDSGHPDYTARVWLKIEEQRFAASGMTYPLDIVGRTGVVSCGIVQREMQPEGEG